jgi:hypothetical protein
VPQLLVVLAQLRVPLAQAAQLGQELADQFLQRGHVGRQRGVRVGEQCFHAPSVCYASPEGQQRGLHGGESAPRRKGRAGSRRLGSLVALEAADVLDIDAVEDHLELAGRQFEGVGVGRGEVEVAAL